MLSLGEIIFLSDPARALGDETGVFNVTAPTGDSFRVTCRHGHPWVSITSTACRGRKRARSSGT